jgi:ABC-type phosphate/phosphonate transport system substrate-binding protein
MYDLPEVRAATDDWWQGLACAFAKEGLEDVPQELTRGDAEDATWQDPALLFSQTCGYPLVNILAGHVQVLATPCYSCVGCDGRPLYRSFIVVRENDSVRYLSDLLGRKAAFNNRHSHSGYNALRHVLAPLARGIAFLEEVIESGTHRASLAFVKEGRADFCAVDCVTFAILERFAPAEVEGLRVLAKSQHAPALPFITAAGRESDQVARLRSGLFNALADPSLSATRETLFLAGADLLPSNAYAAITEMERQALAIGYAELL